jgi:hypothetical protein
MQVGKNERDMTFRTHLVTRRARVGPILNLLQLLDVRRRRAIQQSQQYF